MMSTLRKKIIIDTDPGIDDALAICFALQSKELEVLGLTTVYGNVHTHTATQNALHLLEFFGHPNIPVALGATAPIKGVEPLIASFAHGDDGLGNTGPQPPTIALPIKQPAAEFIINTVMAHPSEVTLLAIAPLTNLALALEQEPKIAQKVKEVVIMGGAIHVNGNVTPAAEANIYNDPDAADRVLTAPWPVTLVPLDVTTTALMSDIYFERIKNKGGKIGKYLYELTRFYSQYHRERNERQNQQNPEAIYGHDPLAAFYLTHPHLFQTQKGAVRVVTDGVARAKTLMDECGGWLTDNGWTDMPAVNVVTGCDLQAFLDVFEETVCGTR